VDHLEGHLVDDLDQDMGERDNDEDSTYPPNERTIHTNTYDLSINTLVEQWSDKTLIIPDFQREYVWDNAKASRLIESLLLNIPIPNLYFAETDEAQYQIVDGHQRVFSVVRYIDNQFALSGLRMQSEFRGTRFFKLPAREQRFLKTRTMRAIILQADSHPNMKFEVFERLNTGGLALNAQEIRNAIYHGTLNDLLKNLETYEGYRSALGIHRPRKRMVDRELVLRFLALRCDLPSYRTPLLRFMNDFMRENRKANSEWIEAQADCFKSTVDLVHSVFQDSAFRVSDTRGRPTERNVNKALFDAHMLIASVADPKSSVAKRDLIVEGMGNLYQDTSFQDSIGRATGDKARTLSRIKSVGQVFEETGVTVDWRQLGSVDWD
jgi:hypothetical protein